MNPLWHWIILLLLPVLMRCHTKSCGLTKLMKCIDMVTPSNDLLKEYVSRNDETRLRNIYERFNFTRVVGSAGHRNAREYIVSTMTNLNWHVEQNEFTDRTPLGDEKKFTNIVASSNSNSRSRLLLACHYDSKDYGPNIVFIGATDSAVPCSILIDVAKSLTKELKAVDNQSISLDLVFFDGEEAFGDWTSTNSIYGARRMASDWEETPQESLNHLGACNRLDSVNALILLDLIGSRGLRLHNLYKDNDCSSSMFAQFREIEQRLRQQNIVDQHVSEIFTDISYPNGAGIEDDHLPFKKKGVTIVHLIPIPFPDVWHTADDHGGNLHWNTIKAMNLITRIFIGQYFRISF